MNQDDFPIVFGCCCLFFLCLVGLSFFNDHKIREQQNAFDLEKIKIQNIRVLE